MNITQPLRLAVGSHQAGSGQGCAMNVISWENGDTVITDMPSCSDPMLARIVQRVNDRICSHRDGDLLCPDCSLTVLRLGHRTVGTTAHGLSDLDLRRVWVRVAVRVAREVLPLASSPKALAAVEAAEAWADDPSDASAATANAAAAAASAAASAYAAAAAAASAAASAYTAAAYTAAYAAYAAAAYTAAYAAYAAAASGDAAADVIGFADLAIDEFYRLTGLAETPADPARTVAAYNAMTAA